MQILQPPTWPKPKGYSNGILTKGDLIFVGGQIGWDETEVVLDKLAKTVEQLRINKN